MKFVVVVLAFLSFMITFIFAVILQTLSVRWVAGLLSVGGIFLTASILMFWHEQQSFWDGPKGGRVTNKRY